MKKVAFTILIGVFIVAVGVMGGIFWKVFLTSEVKVCFNSPEQYQGREALLDVSYSDIQSQLFIFPDEKTETMTIEDFYYIQESYLFTSIYEGILVYTLEEEEFYEEVSRISQIAFEDPAGNLQKCEYAEVGFYYPAYVTVFKDNVVREYALIDKENRRIICIFHQFCDEETGLKNQSYLPDTFTSKNMPCENIYLYKGEKIRK